MSSNDGLPPRHRKKGRARTRGSGLPGRRVRAADPSGCSCPEGFHEYGAHAPGYGPPSVEDAPSHPGAYPVEDLARLSSSAADLLLQRATIEAEAETAKLPHIVIARDVESGQISYSGPFPTGLEALTVAHRFVQQNRAVDPTWTFTLTVAPLLPH